MKRILVAICLWVAVLSSALPVCASSGTVTADAEVQSVDAGVRVTVTVTNEYPHSLDNMTVTVEPPRGLRTDKASPEQMFAAMASGEQVSLVFDASVSAGRSAVYIVAAIVGAAVVVLVIVTAVGAVKKRRASTAILLALALLPMTGQARAESAGDERIRSDVITVTAKTDAPDDADYVFTVTLRYEIAPEALRYTYTGGGWDFTGESITVSGDENGAILLRDAPEDVVYSTFVRLEALRGRAGLLFRCDEDENGLNGYFFGINAASGKLELCRITGGEYEVLADKKHSIAPGVRYDLRVEVAGGSLICYIGYHGAADDPYPAFTMYDTTYKAGSPGFLAQGAEFTDYTVEEYIMQDVDRGYCNPILAGCADPFVLYHEGTYYLYATDTLGKVTGFLVHSSQDLVRWKTEKTALYSTHSWGNWGFWAPEVIEKDGVFYMYYSVEEHLCVATSDSPLGPFVQETMAPMHEDVKEIDSHVFLDDDGTYYIYFVRFGGGNHIWGAKLGDDMMSIQEDTLVRLLSPSVEWERSMAPINEGPFMLKHGDTYYLTYSGDHFQSPGYGVGYATSDSPLGPFVKYENNPIMQSNTAIHGTGHHSFVESPDGSELFMVYHCHANLTSADPRKLCIDRTRFTTNDSGEVILEVLGPTTTYQALPSGAVR